MNVWRVFYAAGLFVFVAIPLLEPFAELTESAAWRWSSEDGERLLHRSLNTLSLVAGTVALALPLGICLAVLVFRTSFAARRLFLLLLMAALFIPLPIIISSWQGTLGATGWLPLTFWSGSEDRPWATGWRAALSIQALAAVPWVACIVGLALTWVEPELEDEAALVIGPWRVLGLVTLPHVRASILAAMLFVGLQTAAEISVTDMMLISTLAEEVHTQFTLGNRVALARTLIVSLPSLLLVWAVVLLMVARLEKTLPPLPLMFRTPRALELGRPWQRWLAAFILVLLLIVPLVSLVWKLGLMGHPPHWSSEAAWRSLRAETMVKAHDLLVSLATSLVAGLLAAAFALVGCWLARDCGWFRWLLFSVLTWAWVLPGPAIGIGLHETILALLGHLPDGPWTTLLYRGPSPAPLIWVQVIRVLPAAMVFLWPIVRLIPRELFEAAALEGAGPLDEFRHVVLPISWRGGLITGLVAFALCLGEVAASTRVETPGWESFTKLLWNRMHDGADTDVAALGLLMLGSLAGCTAMLLVGRVLLHGRSSEPAT